MCYSVMDRQKVPFYHDISTTQYILPNEHHDIDNVYILVTQLNYLQYIKNASQQLIINYYSLSLLLTNYVSPYTTTHQVVTLQARVMLCYQ